MTRHPISGYRTTFLGLFDQPEQGRPAIHKIEIPIIQRDFAQGRKDAETSTIRNRFVDAIVDALTSDRNLGLDFIYGEVKTGVLRPLDGQQRLTTLFLLHWYVASLANELQPDLAWLRFSYATRPTARDFSTALAEHPYPTDATTPSAWITDQPWFVYPWRQDPTITSMLVMLDAIHERLQPASTDFRALWSRLSQRTTHDRDGAIWFLFLPVVDADLGEDLYIKMNSRGRPLTTFEVFKADFEGVMKSVDPERHRHLVDSMDGVWADTLWRYERRNGGDFRTDDEFERYLTFIIDICEWRDGIPERKRPDSAMRRTWPIEKRAALVFADAENPNAGRNRDFFFHAFDTWAGTDPRAELTQLFRAGGVGEGPLPLFSPTPDLFGACISSYGEQFSLQETLLLFGVLLARQSPGDIPSDQVAKRLRSLRNITAAFLDRERMSSYVASTERLILRGTFPDQSGFREAWVADEAYKWGRLEADPGIQDAVHQLEDDALLRGRIMAFDLDSAKLSSRANAFAAISGSDLRDLFGAALLTKGDYSRDVGWGGQKRQLGSSKKSDSWTDLLTTGARASLDSIRGPLMMMLDDFGQKSADRPGASATEILREICHSWLLERESRNFYDWRYYLVRYPGARSAHGNGYYHGRYDVATGFNYGRLRILHGDHYGASYTDALLHAAWVDGSLESHAARPTWWQPEARQGRDNPGLTLKQSSVEIRCKDNAFELVLRMEDKDLETRIQHALVDAGLPFDGQLVSIEQKAEGNRYVDCVDRVQLCVRLVRALVAAGL